VIEEHETPSSWRESGGFMQSTEKARPESHQDARGETTVTPRTSAIEMLRRQTTMAAWLFSLFSLLDGTAVLGECDRHLRRQVERELLGRCDDERTTRYGAHERFPPCGF
jgi:hypothetical protein